MGNEVQASPVTEGFLPTSFTPMMAAEKAVSAIADFFDF